MAKQIRPLKRTRRSICEECEGRKLHLLRRIDCGSLTVGAAIVAAMDEFSESLTDFDCVARLLTSSDPDTRRDAARILKEIALLAHGQQPAVLDLRKPAMILGDSTRPAIIDALRDLEHPEPIASLLDAVSIGRFLPTATVVELAIPLLGSQHPEIQVASIQTLLRTSGLEEFEAMEAVCALAGYSTIAEVKKSCYDAIGTLRGRAVLLLPNLVEQFVNDKDGANEAQLALARALSMIDPEVSSNSLAEIRDEAKQDRLIKWLVAVGDQTDQFRGSLRQKWSKPYFPSFSQTELASALDISRSSVKDWIDSGRIPVHGRSGKNYRVDPRDIQALCEATMANRKRLEIESPTSRDARS